MSRPRETWPVHKMIYDIVVMVWYLLTTSRGRRGSHATDARRLRTPRSRAFRLMCVCLVPLALGPALGLILAAVLNLSGDGAAGGQPTRRTSPLTKVVETSTGELRPVALPTSSYDGQAPSIEPDRRPMGQNPNCWIGTPGWPYDC